MFIHFPSHVKINALSNWLSLYLVNTEFVDVIIKDPKTPSMVYF